MLRLPLMTWFLALSSPPLPVWAPAASATEETVAAPAARSHPASFLPEAVASFGAAVEGGWLYVYGGHIGRVHEHSLENVSPAFRRLNLLDGASWEELPPGPPLQGAVLVAHCGLIYRIGGLAARNRRGDPEDLHSLADVARFDPLARRWEELPSLPEPRSSHDAALVGESIIVVGGWSIAGEGRQWRRTAARLDLSASELRWEALSGVPFTSRALAAAGADAKLVAIGGLTPERERSRAVHFFEPQSGAWSRGPDFPAAAFGVSAAALGGRVFASAGDGVLYRLDAERWEPVGTLLFPRIFHRLAAWGGEVLAIGGAARGRHLRPLERLSPGGGSEARLARWTLPFPGKAKSRQGVLLSGDDLYLFGGNRSLAQHDFAPADFLAEGWRLDLAGVRFEKTADFPARRQSMATLVSGDAEPSAGHGAPSGKAWGLALGGFGHDGEAARSQSAGFRFDPEAAAWEPLASGLPAPRTQFGLVEQAGRLWVFGGLDYDPQRQEPFQHPTAVLSREQGPDGAFASAAELPRPRRAFGGALLDGRYYLAGGLAEGFRPVEECDVFDFASLAWETIPPPSRPRISPELVAVAGKLYLAGGSSPLAAGGFEPNRSLEVYDPETRSWSTLIETLPLETRHLRALERRGRLLLLSTWNALGALELLILEPPREPLADGRAAF
jgi:N-acetylneuraminic acid mutarotase